MMKDTIKLTARFSNSSFPAKDCYGEQTPSRLTNELKQASNGWYGPEEILGGIQQKRGVTLGHHIKGKKQKACFLYTNVLALDFDNDYARDPAVTDHIVYPDTAIEALQKHGFHPNIVY